MKYCKDCKFFEKGDDILQKEICTNKLSLVPQDESHYYSLYLVSGDEKDMKPEYQYASVMRSRVGKCGRDGKLFESN